MLWLRGASLLLVTLLWQLSFESTPPFEIFVSGSLTWIL